MSRQNRQDDIIATFLFGIVALFFGAMLVYAAWAWSPWGCEARWPDRETRWTIGATCQVAVAGEWIPEGNVRGFDE